MMRFFKKEDNTLCTAPDSAFDEKAVQDKGYTEISKKEFITIMNLKETRKKELKYD